jgi:TRAP-type C4-dicarboxylate transport system substrate-binding protein
MKKKGIVIVGSVLFLMLLLIVGGCTASPPAEKPPAETPPAETQTGEPATEQEVFNIKFSTWHPPAGEECQNVWTPMLEELEKRSNGRITYTTYYGAALGAPAEHYDIILDGLSDMGYFTATWTPDRFPLSDVLSMPAKVLGKDVAVDVGNEMYERMLSPEFSDVKVLSLNGCVSSFIWTRQQVHSLEDLKGLKIRSPGGLQTYMIQSLGAEPVFMPLGDVYLSMETGVIDGIVTCPMLYKAYKLQELGKHAVVATFGCVSEGVVMNKGIWEKMPADLQAIVEEVTRNPFQLTGGLTEEVIQACNDSLAAEGVVFYELPAEEAARWYSLFSEEVVKDWVNNMEQKGLPGKEAILNYKAVLDKHGVEFPSFPPEWEEEVEQYR